VSVYIPPAFFFAKNKFCATIKSMKKTFITKNFSETQKLGELLAEELRGREIICLSGELGSGKTTFSQGVLKGLGAKGPYTSPTFLVMRQYHITWNMKHGTKKGDKKMLHAPCSMLHDAYHIDTYRVGTKDILDLGWEEIISSKNNIVIVEWAERIKKIIPERAIWMKFEYLDKNGRKIYVE
jgi:tRNA threonylcarbamoyladenosine biosynthesis protein TsaE